MKCHILFSGKNINLSSAENAQRVVKVKTYLMSYRQCRSVAALCYI